MKYLKKTILIGAILTALFLPSCGAGVSSAKTALPTSFKSDVEAVYEDIQIKLTVNYLENGDISAEFTYPEKFSLNVTGSDYEIKTKSASRIISEDKLPDNGFVKLFTTFIRAAFSSEQSPSEDGGYLLYTAKTQEANAVLYVGKASSVPEKLVCQSLGFSAQFVNFTAN